jgi:hypothetical protein
MIRNKARRRLVDGRKIKNNDITMADTKIGKIVI